MEEQKINVFLKEGQQVIEIRNGEALPLREPVVVSLSGTILSVSEFLDKRIGTIDQLKAIITVERTKKHPSIKLNTDGGDFFGTTVTAKLEPSEDFLAFGINSGKKYTLRDLSDFIKMHRYCFQDKSVAMKLVGDLRNFKAKVNKEMEKVQDQRGNMKMLLDQVVESNVPESFTLSMPLFKGGEIKTFSVEINIIPRDADMDCLLESPEANDLIMEVIDTAIDEQLKLIRDLAPNIVIIES